MHKKHTLQKITWSFGNYTVPIKIYKESRKNVRASIGKTAAILRMPLHTSKSSQEKHLDWFEEWLKKQLTSHPHIQQRFLLKTYKDGDTLCILDRTFTLQIEFSSKKTHSAKLEGNIIRLSLSEQDSPTHLQKRIKQLLSRVIAKAFQKTIERKVDDINDKYFQENINTIRLKYNQSNWGSCSSNKNINLSTRLLFAPEKVIDYVIIHELAHLKEMNHSPKFWNIIQQIMSDYKVQEKWLKQNGHLCDF